MPDNFVSAYRLRPQSMNELNMMFFAQNKTVYKRDGRTHYGCRKKLAVVMIYPRLRLGNSEEEDNKYYEQQLLLYVPHRVENDLRMESETWKDAFERHHVSSNVLDVDWEEDVPDEFDDAQHTDDHVHLDWMAISASGPSGEMPDVMLGRRDLDTDFAWSDSYLSHANVPQLEAEAARLRSRTDEQRGDFSEQMPPFELAPEQTAIVNQLINQLNDEERQPQCSIIQGPAGSGKSAVIQALKATCYNMRNRNAQQCVCVAPTGVAAVNIGGATIHSFFRLPLNVELFASLRRETEL